MSSSHPLAIQPRQDAQHAQWNRIRSAPLSSLATLAPLAPLSAELRTEASIYVSDWLLQHSSSDLPLARLYLLLDHLYRSADSGSDTNASSSATVLQQDDVSQDTSQLPQTPHLSNTRAGTAQVRDTPRSKQTVDSFNKLLRLRCWTDLVSVHTSILQTENPLVLDLHIGTAATILYEYRDDFFKVIAELRNVLVRKESIKEQLSRLYQDLPTVPDRFNASDDRKLAYLLVHLAMTSEHVPRDVDVLDTNRVLTEQFGRTYRGDAQRRFLKFVTRLNQRDQHDVTSTNQLPPYFRGTPIVQSSGTGKSRMIIELDSATPLLYVCFRKREADLNAKAGFPFPDKGVRKYFEDAQRTHPNLCDLQVACFLSAWFQKLANHLAHHTNIQDKARALSQLNQLHADNQERRDFFQEISELAAQELCDTPLLYKPGLGSHAKASRQVPAPSDKDEVFDHCLRGPLLALNQELALISQHLYPHSHSPNAAAASLVPPALVAFDECVEINVSNTPNGNNQLSSLLRAWHFIREFENTRRTPQRLWLVLLSTSSSAAALIEHVSVQSSNRRRTSAAMPAFIGVGFDVLAEEKPSLERASDASRLQQIITYGRPLWASLEQFGPEELWASACLKLQGAEFFDPFSSAQCFSILASRLALRLVPAHWGDSPFLGEQKAFAELTVDRNMRILTHVTQHASLHVDSPSEPVLAIAASLIMVPNALVPEQKRNAADATNWYGKILENFRQRCLLSQHIPIFKGSDGELATRLVLTVAWDAVKEKALRGSPTWQHEKASMLNEPVLLWDILHGLANLESDDSKILKERINTVQELVSRRDVAANVQAWTHFTHFDALPHSFDEITPEYLWYCWKRGVALQMAHSQTGIDGIIPVFIGDLDKRFGDAITSVVGSDQDVPHGARHMTFVAWEAKNRKDAQPSVEESKQKEIHLRKLAGPLLRPPAAGRTAAAAAAAGGGGGGEHAFEPTTSLTERALFCILADLGTDTPFKSSGGRKVRVEMIKHTDCPRLCIRGINDPTTYPCLDHFAIRTIFASLVEDVGDDDDDDDSKNLNTVPHPLWNKRYMPTLPASAYEAAAVAVDGSVEGTEQRMECD